MSNLDINTRRNRTLSEFWHWFVANIPGDSVDDGEVIMDLLFPLVLPEGDGDHRFGYFVLKQPRRLDYSSEGGPTDACSPNMSKGRGPRRSVKDLIRKYDLELTASTFLIIDSDPTSLEIACEWQRCMGGQVSQQRYHKISVLLLLPYFSLLLDIPGSVQAGGIKSILARCQTSAKRAER